MQRILAIDPGGTTGIAYRTDAAAPMEWHVFTLVETDPYQVWNMIRYKTITGYRWDMVICEKFTGEGHMNRVRVDVIELVGGIRALCVEHGIPFAFRSPQNRRAFQDAAKAWHKAHGGPFMDHQEDALAHLLAWEHKMAREQEVAHAADGA